MEIADQTKQEELLYWFGKYRWKQWNDKERYNRYAQVVGTFIWAFERVKNLFYNGNRIYSDKCTTQECEQLIMILKDSKSHLPALTGTEKQIAWATKIRAELFESYEPLMHEIEYKAKKDLSNFDYEEYFVFFEMDWQQKLFNKNIFKEQTSAKWWIENRDILYEERQNVSVLQRKYEKERFKERSKKREEELNNIQN